jgi:protein TonB
MTLAVFLHLAATLLLGGTRTTDTPPTLAQPQSTRVTIHVAQPRLRLAETVEPAVQPRPVSVPRAPSSLPRPEPRDIRPAPVPALQRPEPLAASAPPAAPAAPAAPVRPVIQLEEMPVGADARTELAQVRMLTAPELIDGDVDVAPKPRQAIRPVYPLGARQRGEAGRVVVVIHVSEQGRVEHVDLAQSSGYEALDQAARKALLAARFDPARRGETVVPARVRLTIIFQLKG